MENLEGTGIKLETIKLPPILVTGSHRSGTTWVGKVLSFSPEVKYIFEPFNINVCQCTNRFPFKYWFTYVDGLENRDELLDSLYETLTFRYQQPVPNYYAWHFAARIRLRRWWESWLCRQRRLRPLIKDPIALLSAETISEVFKMQVVCMIRHPLLFCSSIKKWRWDFPFNHFLEQTGLVASFFPEEEDRIREFDAYPHNYVEQATLLWILFHKVIRQYQKRNFNWLFIRHEDLLMSPCQEFKRIHEKLDLKYTHKVKSKITQTLSKAELAIQDTNNPSYKERNASQILNSWKERLTTREVDYILKETEELSQHFYPEPFKIQK